MLHKQNKGFTLIELLVVIGIAIVLAGVGMGSYFGYQTQQSVDAAASEVLGNLRDVQQRAISQDNSSAWGVYIDATTTGNGLDYYEVFSGDSYVAGTVSSKTTLPSDVQFSVPAQGQTLEIVFAKSTGLPNYNYAIAVVSKRNSFISKTVALNTSTGIIGFWTCGNNLTDTRDNKIYSTVLIGTQCWMKQGLDVGTRIAGSSNQGTDCSSVSVIQKYCYDDSDANCDSNNNPNYPDGGLYQWNQAICGSTTEGTQGICPDGWHIPTDNEYKTLEIYLGMTQIQADAQSWRGTTQGDQLKMAGFCQGRTPCGTSGFEGNLAGGVDPRPGYIHFQNRGSYGFFRIFTNVEYNRSLYRYEPDGPKVGRNASQKTSGASVRCLKN